MGQALLTGFYGLVSSFLLNVWYSVVKIKVSLETKKEISVSELCKQNQRNYKLNDMGKRKARQRKIHRNYAIKTLDNCFTLKTKTKHVYTSELKIGEGTD